MIKQLSLLQRFAVIQLMISLLLVFTYRWWCGLFGFYGTDLCWLLQSSYEALQRAFPKYFRVVFFAVWLLRSGFVIWSALFAIIALAGKQLRQNLLLLVISVSLTFLMSEFALRKLSFEPGQFHYSPWVQPVDSLYIVDGFVTDGNGILKVDTALTNEILRHPEEYGPKGDSGDWTYWSEIAHVMTDFGVVDGGRRAQNHFWQHQAELRSMPSADHTVQDSIFLEYIERPFNKEGFFSIPFSVIDTTRPQVLLLGDSFTWGHSAQNKTSSFANELMARGHNILNTGISGADVSQYLEILKKYGPFIQPDMVICNFYLGNDVQYFERHPKQEIPLAFHTSAGVIYSQHHGVQFTSAKAAYENIMSNMVIPKTTLVNRVMSKTVVSTYIWLFCAKMGIVDHVFFKGELYPEKPLTARQIREMSTICDRLGAKFILSVIPCVEDGRLKQVEQAEELFDSMPYHQPEMAVDMYDQTDGHFNSTGHLHYANYLEKLILESTSNQ
jgi:hypothetical protein